MLGRRVVITGCGVVSPVGMGVSATWDALLAGKNGAGTIKQFDASQHRVQIACEVKDFDPTLHLDPQAARKMDRFTQFAMIASSEALRSSELPLDDAERIGVIIGSGIGGMVVYEEQHNVLLTKGPKRVSPFFIPMMIADMAAGLVSIEHGLKGPNYATVSACSSGAHAIGDATLLIAQGLADAMVAGGTEATITPMTVAGFANMKAMSTRNDEPLKACRPFDKGRDGFVVGEGAGIVVLEAEEHARRRGATILAEVAGFGFTADAYHMTAPCADGEGAIRAMRLALDMAQMSGDAIGYINAHGTSTPLNDKGEVLAVKEVFKDHAYKLAMGSTKSMTGHLLGAAGGLESVISALVIQRGEIPPTINYEEPDPDCDLDCVPNEARQAKVDAVLSNSFGFGGHNVSLILRRYEGAKSG
ncbi:MAG TPA: beta-ketoacyl-ACP synthase II [Candidatus Krumholzibacteria bacterium]|jgi:3-oxoacyl-[acyl-carrier-protein] synthase II